MCAFLLHECRKVSAMSVTERRVFQVMTCCMLLTCSMSIAVAYQVGDCLPLTQEYLSKCTNVADCMAAHPAQTCYAASFTCPGGSCGAGPCLAAVQHDNRKYGSCVSAPFETHPPCSHCDKYYCSLERMYQSRNSDNQCQGPACWLYGYRENGCVPSP